MSDYENVFQRQELHEMFTSGEVVPLDDLYLIEDTALTIKELNDKIIFYKDYKKKRSLTIDNEIKILENKINFFKKVIVETLKSNKEKSVKFPGSCSISSRNPAAKWVIDDEEKFVEVLKAAKEDGEKIDDILQEMIEFKIVKKTADKLLDAWQKNGKLDRLLVDSNVPFVHKEIPKTSVSLSYVKPEEDDDTIDPIPVPKKETTVVGDGIALSRS